MEVVNYVLMDIEGTICPISFVRDTLFPYALKALPAVLETKWEDKKFRPYRDAFPRDAQASAAALEAHVKDLTKRDAKAAYHKNLQGYLWEEGYKSGAYTTPLFADVAGQLQKWKDSDIQLAVYSSGSIVAQKLLFEHVNIDPPVTKGKKRTANEAGEEPSDVKDQKPAKKRSKPSSDETVTESAAEQSDVVAEKPATPAKTQTEDLRHLITDHAWFDTTNAGPKTDPSSYNKILAALKWQPARTVFLTDSVKEVDAATEAGLKTILLDRPGNAPVSDADRARMDVVSSLDEIELGTTSESPEASADPFSIRGAAEASGVTPGDASDAISSEISLAPLANGGLLETDKKP